MNPDGRIAPGEAALPARLSRVAEQWVARRDAGLDEEGRAALRAWLAADRRHPAAFAAADRAGTELDWPLHAGATERILLRLAERAADRRRSHRRRGAGLAAAALVALAAFALWRPREAVPTTTAPTLVVKAPERQTLPDGSTVVLKDGAKIVAEFTADRRQVVLAQGTAHFEVVRSARPFVVSAAGIAARALGTAFSVEVQTGRISVLVSEGRVAVDRLEPAGADGAKERAAASVPPLAVLEAGAEAVISTTSPEPVLASAVQTHRTEVVEERLSWRFPLLEFTGTPLAEVVATINRYHRVQFVIADAPLGALTLSGVLRADKIDALVAMLEADFSVRVEREGDRIVLVGRAPGGP